MFLQRRSRIRDFFFGVFTNHDTFWLSLPLSIVSDIVRKAYYLLYNEDYIKSIRGSIPDHIYEKIVKEVCKEGDPDYFDGDITNKHFIKF
jgi:hypothetical protein